MWNRIAPILLTTLLASAVWAQSNVPIVSGGMGFFSNTQGGATIFQPVIAPVVAVPLGDRWLVESRSDLRGVVFRQNGTTGPYTTQFFGTLEYLQVDYLANSRLTLVAGRFLTPFGLFNERLSALWIDKFQDGPILATIGTAGGYSDGVMARGALISTDAYQVNYTAYASTLSTLHKLESQRTLGARAGVYFPHHRLEFGASYQKTLQNARISSQDVYLSWDPMATPLDVKGEWAHSPSGQGYWLQAAYRLSALHGADSPLGRLEPVVRAQQFQRSKPIPGDFLPGVNMRRGDLGLNYYLPHEVRLNGSYERSFTRQGDVNTWQFGVTYRFLFPL